MIEVAAAVIENIDGAILIARRKPGKAQEGLWEFPGGKIEPGESHEACLIRELMEEMNIAIRPYTYLGVNDHRYDSVHIRLFAYKAVYMHGNLMLKDHDASVWVQARDLLQYNLAPADIPFVEKLLQAEGTC
ncbi:(deoxy)nucleoside triphosphate pyrophosphohydrolase [Paenibacillus sp. y28]|uniref:(deoxy)nucleoside triphosphate pyrophosphohydrolase n=1 Tax=Paenibacillus sp. y28 TaxID=3129110 RepID=UPI0030168F85